MGAYETLWSERDATFKSLAERFARRPGSLPSDFVPRSEAHECAVFVKRRLLDGEVESFGVRVHGAGEYPERLRDAAIVAMPDPRLGERGCLFVTLRPGASLDFAAMQRHLEAQQLAKQYWPERLEVIDEMPRTPSGKIQKYKLREIAAGYGPDQA